MSFITLKPSHSRLNSNVYTGDKVRVSFPMMRGKNASSQYCSLVFGRDVCKTYGYGKGDTILIMVDEDLPFLLRVFKDPQGWKLSSFDDKGSLNIKFKWDRAIPIGCGVSQRFTTTRMQEGMLEISLSTANKTVEEDSP